MTKEDLAKLGAELTKGALRRGVPIERHRMEVYFHVLDGRQTPSKMVPFRANAIQARYLATRHLLNVIPKARQGGLSTIIALLIADEVVFQPNFVAGIIDRTDPEAQKKLAMVRYAWDCLDKHADPGIRKIGAWIKSQVRLVTDSKHELAFSNGSTVYAATSLRGGTLNHLWVSELGYIAAKDPAKAEEIAAGSYNTVHAGNRIDIESTHEGGRVGEFYRVIRLAQRSPERPHPLQFKLHFYGWHLNPGYRLAGAGEPVLDERGIRYFENLARLGIVCDADQKRWWVAKRDVTRDLARQFPGTLEEALTAQAEGSIYGEEMALLRARGRVGEASMHPLCPLFTAWDIGYGDPCCIWLLQDTGTEILCLDFYVQRRGAPNVHAAKVIEWERAFGRPVVMNYLPHDARNVTAVGISFDELLRQAGIVDTTVVPRTPDLWAGINVVKGLLPRMRFASACERDTETETEILPSGVGALEGYRQKTVAEGGAIRSEPIHDMASHGSSALRTYCEAFHQGLVSVHAAPMARPRPIPREGPGFKGSRREPLRGVRRPGK